MGERVEVDSDHPKFGELTHFHHSEVKKDDHFSSVRIGYVTVNQWPLDGYLLSPFFTSPYL